MMRSHSIYRQLGIGLLELMVSIVIGLFILAGVLQLFATTSQNAAVIEGSSRIQENARYVFNRLERDIAQAGFAGCFSFTGAYTRQLPKIVNLLGHHATAGGKYNFRQFINATDATEILSSDRLTLRFASGETRFPLAESVPEGAKSVRILPDDAEQIEQYQILMLGDCRLTIVFMVTNDPDSSGVIEFETGITSGGPINDGQFNVDTDVAPRFSRSDDPNEAGGSFSPAYLYAGFTGAVEYTLGVAASASGSETCDAASPQYCALTRSGVELVEGVHDFQIELGWQDAAGALHFVRPNNITSEDLWGLIDRVKVTASFNSIENANTGSGSQLITRDYSRVFLIPNQLTLN